MKILKPKGAISQWFGQNANAWYKKHNLLGHTGIDIVQKYGKNIYSAIGDEYVYKVLEPTDPDRFTAVYTLAVTDMGIIEVCYGHLSKIDVFVGDIIPKGLKIGEEGNYGEVYTNGIRVSRADKIAGSRAGSHLHFQIRPVGLVSGIVKGEHYLRNKNGSRARLEGQYLHILNKDNGYNGNINPAPYFYIPTFSQFLHIIINVLEWIKNKVENLNLK